MHRRIGTMQKVSAQEWRAAQDRIKEQEKELTRAHDRLAAERRRAPWMAVDKAYSFEGESGTVSLSDLFEGRKQLIVYHHMLKADDPHPCPGCCMVGDQIPHLAHLHQRDTTLAFVSRAPLDQILALRSRMGWSMPWYSTLDSFNPDFNVDDGFGFNVFIRHEGGIFRTYFTSNRGAETLGTVWTLLDLTPMGRGEKWEESPEWVAQTAPYTWWKLHDEY